MARGYKAEHPCSLCGQPTRSKLSVCYRPGECRNENKRLTKAAIRGKVVRQRHPCSICGKPTSSKFPVCSRAGRCRIESQRLYGAEARTAQPARLADSRPAHPCALCGEPTASRFPVCSRRGKCRTEHIRLRARERNGSDLRETEQAHPCSLCGQQTTSSLPVCTRPGKCKASHMRLRARKARGAELSDLREASLSPGPDYHPCSLCGLPTASAYPVCGRRNGRCNIEHNRLKRAAQDKGQRNEAVRRYRAGRQRQSVPSVYGVWFPSAQVLKVGFTTHVNDSPFVCSARTRAERRGWGSEDSLCIWKQPGDLRTEAWMQATLAFQWRPAFEQKQSRICEWFAIPGLTAAQVAGVLDEIYGFVPTDRAGTATVERELVPIGSQFPMF